jgi:hypothetical protein
MDASAVQKVSQEIYRRFPDLQGKKPQVKANNGRGLKPASALPSFILVFSTRTTIAGGRSLPLNVRVVADSQGEILKLAVSH